MPLALSNLQTDSAQAVLRQMRPLEQVLEDASRALPLLPDTPLLLVLRD